MAARFVSFGEWQGLEAERILALGRSETVECYNCNGGGSFSGSCDCCDHKCHTDCDICHGSGELVFADLTPVSREKVLTRSMYTEAVRRDAQAWSSWTGQPLNDVLAEAGIS